MPAPVYAFIDSNIFLDFYRESTEATLSMLHRLAPVRERIISTYQVEMEYLKNRQQVILTSLDNLRHPPPPKVPAIFSDSATNQSLRGVHKTAEKKAELIRKRIHRMLRSPTRNDVVFRALSEIFRSSSDHVLTRDMPIRHQIKRLAWRRFVLGYPPRKPDDTSTGDALNWEWIVHCGKALQGKIIIVSRDGDFGITLKSECFLNDQLEREYRDRVGPRRRLVLTNRLSEALRELDVRVPQQEIDAEEAAIAATPVRPNSAGSPSRASPDISEILDRLIESWKPLLANRSSSRPESASS